MHSLTHVLDLAKEDIKTNSSLLLSKHSSSQVGFYTQIDHTNKDIWKPFPPISPPQTTKQHCPSDIQKEFAKNCPPLLWLDCSWSSTAARITAYSDRRRRLTHGRNGIIRRIGAIRIHWSSALRQPHCNGHTQQPRGRNPTRHPANDIFKGRRIAEI